MEPGPLKRLIEPGPLKQKKRDLPVPLSRSSVTAPGASIAIPCDIGRQIVASPPVAAALGGQARHLQFGFRLLRPSHILCWLAWKIGRDHLAITARQLLRRRRTAG